MSKSHEAKRGVQSVRCHYGVDESKILPSLLDAIPDGELESIKWGLVVFFDKQMI